MKNFAPGVVSLIKRKLWKLFISFLLKQKYCLENNV